MNKILTLIIRNTHFVVKFEDYKVNNLINNFNTNLITYKLVYNPKLKRYFKEEDKHYYYRVNDTTYHYSIHLVKVFIKYAMNYGVSKDEIDVVYETTYKPNKLKCRVRPEFKDRDHQPKYIKKAKETNPMVLVDLKTGKGKAHPLTERILTPDGWKQLKELKVGDRVITPKGTDTRIRNIYPRGTMAVYQLQFNNRIIHATKDHLWEVKEDDSEEHIVVDTEYLLNNIDKKFYIKIPQSYDFKSKYDVDYSLIGFIMTYFEYHRHNEYTCEHKWSYPAYNRIRTFLRDKDVNLITIKKGSNYYLRICVSDVIDTILSTLSPTDMSILDREAYIKGSLLLSELSTGGRFKIVGNKNPLLKEIIHSLGGWYSEFHIEDNRYSILFNLPTCTATDTSDRTLYKNSCEYFTLLAIIEVSKEKVACIEIEDEDRLYIAGDYIPTHNTYISMRVADELKYPTGIVILARYIEKWVSDLKTLTTVKDEDIYVVQGMDSLIKLLESDKQYDFVIFSLTTLRRYIEEYDKTPDYFNVSPENLFSYLGLGMMLNDEVHQSFYAVYMTMIRLNPLKVLSLSATLDNLDQNIRKIYRTLFPDNARCGNLAVFDNYIKIISVIYKISTPGRLKYMTSLGYSHVMFEKSILRSHSCRKHYLDMLYYYTMEGYVKRAEPGDKILIFVQTIKMATLVTNYLQSRLKQYNVLRYVEEDPYENILTADITVSTNLSAGTALDIPNLITVIQTVPMRSLQANVQSLGRLREIKGKEVRYYDLFSTDIPNHRKLHKARKQALEPHAREYVYDEYQVPLIC